MPSMLNEHCTCPLRPNMSWDELYEEVYKPRKNCCEHLGYVCPTLAKETRRADKERHYTTYRKQQLKKQGFTDEEATQKAKKRSKTKVAQSVSIDLDTIGV